MLSEQGASSTWKKGRLSRGGAPIAWKKGEPSWGREPIAWKEGELTRGRAPIAWKEGEPSWGGAPIAWKEGELTRGRESTPWEKGALSGGGEALPPKKGGRNGVLSMGAFCVEAGVSPRDGAGYKKGGTDLSQVRPAEIKCYKSGYKKPCGWEAVLNLLSDYLRSCLGRSFSILVSGLSGPVSALLFHH